MYVYIYIYIYVYIYIYIYVPNFQRKAPLRVYTATIHDFEADPCLEGRVGRLVSFVESLIAYRGSGEALCATRYM